MYCKYCKKEIPYKHRKSHECDEYWDYLDDQAHLKALSEQKIVDARMEILTNYFTDSQAEAIIELVEHMIQEN